MSPEITSDTDEVAEAVREYRTALRAMDDKGAVESVQRLTEEDCKVCQQIGRFLGGLGVAVLSAPGKDQESALMRKAGGSILVFMILRLTSVVR